MHPAESQVGRPHSDGWREVDESRQTVDGVIQVGIGNQYNALVVVDSGRLGYLVDIVRPVAGQIEPLVMQV